MTALARVAKLLGNRFDTSQAVREQFAQGEGFQQASPPDAVAFPVSTAEVSEIAASCFAEAIPMVPIGAATSFEGQISAPHGGLAISLSRMTQVLEVNGDDFDAKVEAGVSREALNLELRHSGLFFPIDPGANASLGGMAATRASGTNAVRYGTMAQNVLGLTVVQPDGTVIHTGGRARKSSAGYDLTRLYVGSEGTLGIITEVRLRLQAIPETICSAICAFDDASDAANAVRDLIQAGVAVARVEFLDTMQVRASNAYSGTKLPEKSHLFFEFHGSPSGTQEQAAIAADISAGHGGGGFEWTHSTEERNRLWKARHNAYFAAMAMRPGAEIWTSDVCVPISDLPRAIVAVRDDIERHGLIAPIVGHAGDGNFHVLFLLDPKQPEERAAAEGVYDRMIDRALACGGTCTGEHGIGVTKRGKLLAEHGESAVATMRSIKRALDPKNLMNPGKIFL
ncbi:MAG TPA: FAD-linked oxidase C-terminal domain-containing protein [Sphingomicrobium sp.]